MGVGVSSLFGVGNAHFGHQVDSALSFILPACPTAKRRDVEIVEQARPVAIVVNFERFSDLFADREGGIERALGIL